MHKTFLSIGFILLSLSAVPSEAVTPKSSKTPTAGASTKPSGADALTGTSVIRSRTKPSGAGSLVEKWQTFKAPGVELALPENYRGGSPNTTGLQTLIKGIRSLGTDYEQIASMVEQNPSTFLLIAVDPKPDRTGGVTNVVVSAVKVPETVTVEAYIDAAVQSLPTPLRTIERKTVQVGQNPAGRLVTEASLPSSTAQADAMRQLIYVIKQGTTLWTVAYSTRAGDYQQRLAMFEQSIQSFKVQVAQKPGNTAAPVKPATTPPASSKQPAPALPTGDKKPNAVPKPNPKPESKPAAPTKP
ncbi:hypothetical protein [Stenomitos frigidus]|uniref:DUF1795 domain-containing protein n=1 Tax=Stenomitos frigidus ULC18 TaxID=2107698 RepID=A0A2T1E2N6_9CYAN|nr:hypothetical protein [Stenomitos frigidus]PSB26997.1 hypothetical protein C7B82_17730 [Stenomitos frigidus ULC18]